MNKSTLIALAVFAALVAGGIYAMNRDRSHGISRVSLADVKTDSVDALELSGKNVAKLSKKDGVWHIETAGGQKPADDSMVKRALENIPKVVSSDMVTTSKEKHGEYEVDDEKGTRVKASAGGKVVAEFVLGKSAKGGTHVRVGDEVYAVNGVYGSTFARAQGDWIDKKIVADKVEEVTKVKVALAGKAPYTLVKNGEEWKVEEDVLPKGFRFDAAAAKRLVSSLVSLRAKDVLDADPGADTTKLEGNERDVIRYTVKSGDTETEREVVIGALKDGANFVKISGRNDVFTVYESTAANLDKQPSDFRDLSMVKLDTSKVKQLTVVDGAKRLVLEKKGADWAVASSSEKIPADFQLDPAAVTRRLSALSSARGTEVAAVSPAAAGVTAPSGSVTAVLEDNSKVVLAFGKTTKEKDKEIVYARGNIDDAVYVITPYMKTNLVGTLDSVKKRPDEGDGLANLDPKALSGLPPDVRAQLEQQINQKKREQELLKRLQQQTGN